MAKISARGAYKVAEVEASLYIPERHYGASEHGPAFTSPEDTVRYVFVVRSDGAILVANRIDGGYRDGRRGGYSVWARTGERGVASLRKDVHGAVEALVRALERRGYQVTDSRVVARMFESL